MSVKLLTEHHLEFLSLKGGCTGSPMSKLVKMLHCWKSHVSTQIILFLFSKDRFVLTNSAYTYEMPRSVVFNLGLNCLSKYSFTGKRVKRDISFSPLRTGSP